MRNRFINESENTDRWLVSYADFITLMFAFFVVMYSMSQVNEGKYKVLSETLMNAFDQPERSLQPIQIGEINRTETMSAGEDRYPLDTQNAIVTEESNQAFEEFKQDLNQNLEELIEADIINVNANEYYIEIEIKGDFGFAPGTDDLTANMQLLIDSILEQNSEYFFNTQNLIELTGHTDDRPIITRRFPSNWALSSARAISVLEYLQNKGIPFERMVAMGYSYHSPAVVNGVPVSNETEEGRSKNRRVTIRYTKRLPEQYLQNARLEQGAQQQAQPTAQTANPAVRVTDPLDPSNIDLIRAPDGTLIIRGRTNDDQDDNDQNNDSPDNDSNIP
jgi:chemotaxis protein MotB